MKRFLYFISFIGATFFLISNTAQPGVWNAGGSGTFTLLYPEDSIAYKKIQMQSEKIYMQLYKGYAVVKGTYHFYNTSDDTLKIKVGYPINNVFKNVDYNRELNEVQVDGLYKIKAQLNEIDIPVFKIPNNENDNWYVWEVTYPPKKITTFTVYFLVNTNNAVILEGYNKEYKNAFIYLIETGSLWKSPIEKGEFYTQLMDAVDTETIKGSTPTQLTYNPQKKIFRFTMEDYGKKPDPNFVLTYGEKIDDFDFKSITNKEQRGNDLMKLTLKEAEILIRKYQIQLQRALGNVDILSEELTKLRNELKVLKQRNTKHRQETDRLNGKIKALESRIDALL